MNMRHFFFSGPYLVVRDWVHFKPFRREKKTLVPKMCRTFMELIGERSRHSSFKLPRKFRCQAVPVWTIFGCYFDTCIKSVLSVYSLRNIRWNILHRFKKRIRSEVKWNWFQSNFGGFILCIIVILPSEDFYLFWMVFDTCTSALRV